MDLSGEPQARARRIPDVAFGNETGLKSDLSMEFDGYLFMKCTNFFAFESGKLSDSLLDPRVIIEA